MIESKYVSAESIPEFDEEVSSLLASYGIEGGGKPMKIAIENFDGRVYRALTTWGLGPFMHVVQALPRIGLKDTLETEANTRGGFDAWFVTTPDTVRVAPVPIDQASDILSELDAFQALPETERRSLILSRVGQGAFRAKLIEYWRCCAVSGATCVPLLKASHIKPWRDSSNLERLDVFNGLLLSPNLDAAFDAGFITFDSAGKVLMSTDIGAGTAYQLHISPKSRIASKLLTSEHEAYLAYHRAHVFRG
jgi:hypothetical protein